MTWHLLVPGATVLLWLAHARSSWRRPASVGPVGWLLHLGLPTALAVTVVVFAHGSGDDWFPWSLVLGAELFLAWVAVLALESPLSVVRSSRQARAVRSAAGEGSANGSEPVPRP